jgi:hypothetical protein
MQTSTNRFLIIVGAWGVAAAAAGSGRVLAQLPPLVLPVVVFGSSAALVAGLPRGRWLGKALGSLGARGILAVNLGRFVGFAFLWESARGRLPEIFAERAGWGDVVAAAGALVLLFWRDGPAFRRALVAWNLFGLLDLLVAVGTAVSFALGKPGSMAAMAHLPFCLIPFWIVPILLSMHVYLLLAAYRERGGRSGAQGGPAVA